MIYGYCRVSTKGQATNGNSLEVQENAILERYENAIIYKEAYTAKTTNRPIFSELVANLKAGDTLVVAKLDRLARNTVEGIEIVKQLFEKKVSVHVLNVGLLENTAMGQFFITTLLAVAELERTTILERTQTGKELAKEKPDFREGRPQKYTDEELREAVQMLASASYNQVSKQTGISKSTLQRAVACRASRKLA